MNINKLDISNLLNKNKKIKIEMVETFRFEAFFPSLKRTT